MQGQEQNQEGQEGRVGAFGAISLFVFDFLKVFIVAVAIIIPIRWFLFQPFVVTGDSMEPNYSNGNYLIVDEISYRVREPERGEVVVLRFPNDPSQFFIKRIIGLPQERLLIENGRVRVFSEDHPQGILLDEEYLPSNNITLGNIDRTLKPDEYFVLGDNRLSSSDSRIWGALGSKYIVGRVYLRVFPVSDFGIFKIPVYASSP
ncbi:MAG: signal peptidase I [bacterium]|nr:signal peptidase I [bacterium]